MIGPVVSVVDKRRNKKVLKIWLPDALIGVLPFQHFNLCSIKLVRWLTATIYARQMAGIFRPVRRRTALHVRTAEASEHNIYIFYQCCVLAPI
jgi:hypothetical protein